MGNGNGFKEKNNNCIYFTQLIIATVATAVAGEAAPHVGLTDFSSGEIGGGTGDGSGLNEYVNEALLERVAELISSGGDGSGTPQGTEGRQIPADILARVSSSLRGGNGGGRATRPVYGAPVEKPEEPAELGDPEPAERIAEFDLSGESTSNNDNEQGGYEPPQQSSVEDSPPPSAYGAPFTGGKPLGLDEYPQHNNNNNHHRNNGNGNHHQANGNGNHHRVMQHRTNGNGQRRPSSSTGKITLGRPMAAMRVADFSVMGDTAAIPSLSADSGTGYN